MWPGGLLRRPGDLQSPPPARPPSGGAETGGAGERPQSEDGSRLSGGPAPGLLSPGQTEGRLSTEAGAQSDHPGVSLTDGEIKTQAGSFFILEKFVKRRDEIL